MLALVALGAGLALAGYFLFEPLDRSGWMPAVFRAVAWAVLALLLINPGCAIGPATTPLVLLDGSLSMAAAGGRWDEAVAQARAAGEVRLFGDPARTLDSLPAAGHSRLGPALAAAAATGRPVTIVTDGELEDFGSLQSDLVGLSRIRVLPRVVGPAIAVRSLEGPDRVSVADTVELVVGLAFRAMDGAPPVRVTARLGGRELASTLSPVTGGSAPTILRVLAADLGVGEHLVEVGVLDSVDTEVRDNTRLHSIRVATSPGVVLITAEPDWESRFLLTTLQDVTSTPVAGYALIAPGQWRRMTDLQPLTGAQVIRAWRDADVAVVLGSPPGLDGPGPRGLWRWPSSGSDPVVADWYLTAAGASPIAAALAGLPADSFPPAQALVRGAIDASQGWVAMTARASRRGAEQPALIGWEVAGRREATTLVRGLWRWSFRGGVAEQAYRAVVASTMDWLLGSPRAEPRLVRLVRPVVPAGTAVGFQWQASGTPVATAITLTAPDGGERIDTLRFGGNGMASLFLPVGTYRFAMVGSGDGRLTVEPWSPEWFPREVRLVDSDPSVSLSGTSRGIREQRWLFGLAVAALCAEWLVRRRRGLR